MTIPTFEEVMLLTGTISNIHMLQVVEAEAMYDTLCQLPNGATLVEIGCDHGRSSSLIFQMAKAKNLSTIHIDPWHWEDDQGTQATKAKEWMELMCERCAYHPFILLRMTTEEAAEHLANLTPQGIELAFIDGSHDQDVVVRDLKIVAERVNRGGFLTAHDYPSGGVTEANRSVRCEWMEQREASRRIRSMEENVKSVDGLDWFGFGMGMIAGACLTMAILVMAGLMK